MSSAGIVLLSVIRDFDGKGADELSLKRGQVVFMMKEEAAGCAQPQVMIQSY